MFYAKPRPLYSWESYLESIVQEAGWTSGFVWTRAGYLASSGTRPPDSLVRSALKFFNPPKVGVKP